MQYTKEQFDKDITDYLKKCECSHWGSMTFMGLCVRYGSDKVNAEIKNRLELRRQKIPHLLQ